MLPPNDASQSVEASRVRFAQLFPELSPAVISQFVTFKDELLKANSTLSLIAASSINHIETLHFADSVKAGDIIFGQSLPDGVFYDLGSGNGFPGLIFAMMRPERQFVLVEKDSRRVEFLERLMTTLQMKNARVLGAAVEDLPERSIKLGVARGFAALSKAMLMTRKSTELDGSIFYIKGNNWPQELAGVPSQLFTYWDASMLGSYRIPETETDMSVISTKKTSN